MGGKLRANDWQAWLHDAGIIKMFTYPTSPYFKPQRYKHLNFTHTQQTSLLAEINVKFIAVERDKATTNSTASPVIYKNNVWLTMQQRMLNMNTNKTYNKYTTETYKYY